MTVPASFDDLQAESIDGEIRLRHTDGTVLGVGIEKRVVPALEDALADLDDPRGTVDGVPVRGACIFELTDTNLVVGRAGEKVALIFRDATSAGTRRVDLSAAALGALRAWLETIDTEPTDIRDWPGRRAEVLADMAEVTAARRSAESAGASMGVIQGFRDQMEDLRRRYINGLPQVPIARDPLEGGIVTAAIDTAGLDGPFWDAENPYRPAEPMPASFVVLSGAMRLSAQQLEYFQHLCRPGPPVPFVVPDLLKRDGVKAVVATVPVGPHTGYAISYFSPRDEPPPIPNEWGRGEFWLRHRGHPTTMDAAYDNDPAPDFDILPWIRSEKLAWVAPKDPFMKLRWVPDRCPYLVPQGNYEHQRAQVGKVW